MYAATANSNVYHFTESPNERTLCGVRFIPILMDQPGAAGLRLVRQKPAGYKLCRHCDRVRDQERISYGTTIFD